MSSKVSSRRQTAQEPVPSTSRGPTQNKNKVLKHKHAKKTNLFLRDSDSSSSEWECGTRRTQPSQLSDDSDSSFPDFGDSRSSKLRNSVSSKQSTKSRSRNLFGDSDSSNIENNDSNIPKLLKSKKPASKIEIKQFKKDKRLAQNISSDDDSDLPIVRRKAKSRTVIQSESDSDIVQTKKRKASKKKLPVVYEDDSEDDDDEDVIPKFKAKKCRLIDFSDEEDEAESTSGRSAANNNNASTSRAASERSRSTRQLSGTLQIDQPKRKRANNRSRKYFLDDEANRVQSEDSLDEESDENSGGESDWDSHWESDWEAHWNSPNRAASPSPAEVPPESSTSSKAKSEAPSSEEKESTSTEVAKLNDSVDSSSDNCPICLLDFKQQKLGTPASCDHVFCLDCILEWCKVVNTCPADRKEFTSINVRGKVGGEVLYSLPVQERIQNTEENIVDSTVCEICGQADREDTMLLCDVCDAGYHMDCLTPPLTEVPHDEWLCPGCTSSDVLDDERFPDVQRFVEAMDSASFLTLFSVFSEIFGGSDVLEALDGSLHELSDILPSLRTVLEMDPRDLDSPTGRSGEGDRMAITITARSMGNRNADDRRRRRRRSSSSHRISDDETTANNLSRRRVTSALDAPARDPPARDPPARDPPARDVPSPRRRRHNATTEVPSSSSAPVTLSRSTSSTSNRRRSAPERSTTPPRSRTSTQRRNQASGDRAVIPHRQTSSGDRSSRERHSPGLRGHTHTNFRSPYSRRTSQESRASRLTRRLRLLADSSSSDD